jgi:hypothetical protein
VSTRVKTAIDAGTSLEDLLKAKPLADLDATWGQGFLNSDQFLTIVYEGFKNKNS